MSDPGPITLSLQGVNMVINGGLLVMLLRIGKPFLREYKIYGRMKERLNTLWRRHCQEKDEYFVPLENGRNN